jgi:hypothetical protein
MPVPEPEDATRLDEFVQRQVEDAVRRRRAQERADAALRAETLASDLDRDRVSEVLNEAFAQGRLTADEHADRTTRTFLARTHGDLERVLTGLHVPPAPVKAHAARKALFWIVSVFTSPFLLAGSGLLFFGTDLDDRVWGIILLVLFAPGLFALHRWAWPKVAKGHHPVLP